MSVTNGQIANQNTFNNAFASKSDDNILAGKQEITDTTASTNKDTGSLVLGGGLGVEGRINSGGAIKTVDTTASTSSSTGSLVAGGGLGVAGDANINGDVSIGGALSVTGSAVASNLSGTNTGDISLGSVGSSPNANGASLSGQVLNLEPANATNPGVVSTASQTFSGDKTFADDVIITGDLTVNGTMTAVNSANLEVADKNILVNNGGNDASSEGAGLTVERTSTNGSIAYQDSLSSKWKAGIEGSESEVMTVGTNQTVTGNKTHSGYIEIQGKLIGDIATDSGTTGSNAALPAPSKTDLRITNASLSSIATITSPTADQLFNLHNVTGNDVTVVNSNSGSTDILTGTGSNIVITNDSSISLFYDSSSSRWRVIGSPSSVTGANVGTGAGNVFRDKTGQNINLKTIKAGSNVSVTDNADDITISASGESNTAANVGTGTGNVFRDKTGVTINLKTIKAGANITVTNNADDVTIASSGGFTSPLTTKGDIHVRDATTDARLPVGSNGQFLVADSAQSTGLAWQATLPIANGGTGQSSQSAAFNALSPMTTKGDIIAGAASGAGTRVAIGSNDQFLIADSAQSTGVKWSSLPTSTVTSLTEDTAPDILADMLLSYDDNAAAFKKVLPVRLHKTNVTTVTSNATLTATDEYVEASASGGAFTITLPAVSGTSGRSYVIKKISASSATLTVTIDGNGSETIDGSLTKVLHLLNESIHIKSNGSAWYVVDYYCPTVSGAFYTTASNSIGASYDTKIVYNSTADNAGANLSLNTGTGVVTILKPGRYVISAQVVTAASTDFGSNSLLLVKVYVNGSGSRSIAWNVGNGTYQFGVNGGGPFSLSASDTVDIRLFQNTAGSISLDTTGLVQFNLTRIGD